MSNQLAFHNTELSVINHNNQIWLSSSELSKALQYTDSKSVTRLYNANSDEFTPLMTEVIESVTSGNLKVSTRIFSLRGCHLIAMFSRTKIAKEFRKWVLDILDKQVGIISTITTEQKYLIRKAVNERAYRTGEHHQSIYHKLYDYFKINSYEALPANKFDEAIKFLGGVNIKSYQFTDDELCTLSWCYKAAERMRQHINLVTDALYQIKSEYAPSFYSMGVEYKRTLENTRVILDRETKHIELNQQGYLSNNWRNVLPNIRQNQIY